MLVDGAGRPSGARRLEEEHIGCVDGRRAAPGAVCRPAPDRGLLAWGVQRHRPDRVAHGQAALEPAVRNGHSQAGILRDQRQRGVAAVLLQRQVAAAGLEHGQHRDDGVRAGLQQQPHSGPQAGALRDQVVRELVGARVHLRGQPTAEARQLTPARPLTAASYRREHWQPTPCLASPDEAHIPAWLHTPLWAAHLAVGQRLVAADQAE